jgi:hypothetical protein
MIIVFELSTCEQNFVLWQTIVSKICKPMWAPCLPLSTPDTNLQGIDLLVFNNKFIKNWTTRTPDHG